MKTRRRPNRSAKLPAPITSPARVAMKATNTHWTLCRSAFNPLAMDGKATLTEMSNAARNIPRPATAATTRSLQLGSTGVAWEFINRLAE